ncbi:MAG: thioesterase family protein [Acidimicrobiia bacterium]
MTASGQPAAITIQRKVEWVDTDASGHWHNTAVVRLCEMAESALLEALDLEGLFYSHGAPRVRMQAEFRGSARFGDLVEIHCSVVEVGRSKIVFAHQVAKPGQQLASVEITAVLVDANGSPRSFPDDVRKTLLQAGPQGIGV